MLQPLFWTAKAKTLVVPPATAERVAEVQSSADLAPSDLAADCAMCT